MKKSFMTRALAMGLSFAMAFSLSAATNVTTAAAAAKPAMKNSKMTVKVGQTKNYNATAATAKAYKITKTKMSSANKDKATVTVKGNKKGITVTGEKAVKSANVRIYFKNTKTKKTTSVVSKLTVKEVITKQSIVSAEVTGVKTVTLTMAKDVASVESPVAITVKKGAASRPCTATAEGKTITLKMEAKLTQGSYTVSIAGLETETLTKDFAVEKDETLTSFEIADYLVAKSVSATTTGSIKFAALNQYGEKMVANDPTVTCSFGSVAGQKPSKSATATAQGVIEVTDINPVLAIPGQKGTVVLVGDMGVTATKEISYNTFAKATKAEVIGLYHINSAKLATMKENDTIAEYELLMKFTDQYDSVMNVDELGKTVRVTISGGLTNIDVNTNELTTRTYNGEDYVAVKLKGSAPNSKATAGDATLIITNDYYGMLINDKLTVSKSVVIKSMTITDENGIYQGQDNELSYEFLDAEGNSVTDYATLVDCNITFNSESGTKMRLERQKDGKAKLLFDATDLVITEVANTDKATKPISVTASANKTTGGDYFVKTFTFTGRQARYAKGVTGIKPGVTTSISKANTTKNITIKSTDIYLADQYSNKIASDEKIFNKTFYDKTATDSTSAGTSVSGTAVAVVTSAAFNEVYVDTTGNKIIATPSGIEAGTATVYLKFTTGKQAVTASSTNYDAKFTITAYETKNVDTSTLKITEVLGNWDVTTSAAAALTVTGVVVKATVGGAETVIPTDQYVIVKNENKNFTQQDDLNGVNTKTAKVTVQVTTWDSANTPTETTISKEYTVSREGSKLFKVTGTVGDVGTKNAYTAVSTNAVIDSESAHGFLNQFKFRDQYGAAEATGGAVSPTVGTLDKGCVTYTIEMVDSDRNTQGYAISHNGTNTAQIKFTAPGQYKFKVTATAANGSTKTVTYYIQVS